MQKFMTTYKEIKPSVTCQFTVLKSGSTKARCNEVAIPCTNYCLNHLVMKSESKNKTNFDKLPVQVAKWYCQLDMINSIITNRCCSSAVAVALTRIVMNSLWSGIPNLDVPFTRDLRTPSMIPLSVSTTRIYSAISREIFHLMIFLSWRWKVWIQVFLINDCCSDFFAVV